MSDAHDLSIRLFSSLKDRAGKQRISLPLPTATRVDAMLEQLAARYPELADALPSTLVAVNRAYADRDTPVNPGDEVALFPPVSGG